MRGKSAMFVGDSLGRNQWESLICMISAAVPKSPTQILKGDPLSTFKFLEQVKSIQLNQEILQLILALQDQYQVLMCSFIFKMTSLLCYICFSTNGTIFSTIKGYWISFLTAFVTGSTFSLD